MPIPPINNIPETDEDEGCCGFIGCLALIMGLIFLALV